MKTDSLKRQAPFFWMIVTLAFFVSTALPQEKSPFAGAWIANLSKSQRHPNHLFKSATIRVDVTGDIVLLVYTGVNMSGREESGTSKLHPDGKEHPLTEAPGVVEVSRWLSSRILETVAKKDGKVVGEGKYEISSDGKTMTAKMKGIDATGSTFEQVIVFDRQ